MTVSKRWLANYNKRIQEENQWFKGLTKSQKRVQIALDVLTQLRTKRIVAQAGMYFEGTLSKDELQVSENTDMQEVLRNTETCTACAVGSLFVCAVERFDKFKATDVFDYDEVDKEFEIDIDQFDSYLEKFFTPKQLGMMEAAFEGFFHNWDASLIPLKEREAAISFFKGTDLEPQDLTVWSSIREIEDRELAPERLRLIMENLVINNGTFDPFKKPVKSHGRWSTPGIKVAKEEFAAACY